MIGTFALPGTTSHHFILLDATSWGQRSMPPCPLRARSAGQCRALTVTAVQLDTPAQRRPPGPIPRGPDPRGSSSVSAPSSGFVLRSVLLDVETLTASFMASRICARSWAKRYRCPGACRPRRRHPAPAHPRRPHSSTSSASAPPCLTRVGPTALVWERPGRQLGVDGRLPRRPVLAEGMSTVFGRAGLC